ncbi:MAG: protease Lon-related BREX system protein BrxL [Candidatus Odinarchaeota archaeon]
MSFANLDEKILQLFSGLVVRKDLASKLKGAYPIPTYVLEFLLGRYCSSPNEEVIEHGLKKVRELLEDHYVDPEKVEVIKSKIRESGTYKVLDRFKVRLIPSEDTYWGELSSLNLQYIHISDDIIENNERMLLDGVWGIITLGYDSSLSRRGRIEPFVLQDFQPVQLSSNLAEKLIDLRKEFSDDEWLELLLRSIGLEPEKFDPRQRMHLLSRLIPFVEHNINFVEFGPRSTGKSFSYRELSPHSILISGGETSVANLFVSNIGAGKPGLVTFYDVVAFDEVAGLARFSNTQQLQIFKDYMESGTFSRGKGEYTGRASLVFVGNFDEDVHTALQNQHLFTPFPVEMQDLAFLDRFHIYLPGWELPRFTGDMFTDHYGFIVDLLAEYFQLMRNKSFYSDIESAIDWGEEVDQRDKVRIRAVTSGFLKLMHPDGNFSQEQLEACLKPAIEYRRRVKEQLKKMGSVEFRKTNLSYFIKGMAEESFVTTPEFQLANKYSPLEGIKKSGIGFTIGKNEYGRNALYRIEVGLRKGHGTWNATGLAGKPIKEALITVRDYVKANLKRVHPVIEEHSVNNNNVHVQVVDLMKTHEGSQTGLGFFISVLSGFTKVPILPRTIIVGEMTISGSIIPIQNVAETVLIAKENGAERLLLPESSKSLMSVVPDDITADIEIIYYSDPVNAWDLTKDDKSKSSEEEEEMREDYDIPLVTEPGSPEPLESPEVSAVSKTSTKSSRKRIVVDGNNVAYEREPRNSPVARKIVMLYHWLKNSFGMDIQIFVSSALKHFAKDFSELQGLIDTGHVQETPAGVSDDYFIINYAVQTDSLILSNDRYKEWKEKYPNLKEEIDKRRVTYVWDFRRRSFLLGELPKGYRTVGNVV